MWVSLNSIFCVCLKFPIKNEVKKRKEKRSHSVQIPLSAIPNSAFGYQGTAINRQLILGKLLHVLGP